MGTGVPAPGLDLFVCRGIGAASDAVEQAARVATALQRHRANSPAMPLGAFLYTPHDPSWSHVVAACLRRSVVSRTTGPERWGGHCKAKADRVPRTWAPWAGARPLWDAELRGCGDSKRVREHLDDALLEACHRRGLDPQRAAELEEAKETS